MPSEPDAFQKERDRFNGTGGWTLETLREDLLLLLKANDLRYQQRYDAQQQTITDTMNALRDSVQSSMLAADRAVNKAEMASEKRFEGVNEFRSALADQQRTLMPRSETEMDFKAISERVDIISKQITSQTGSSTGIHTGWVLAFGAFGFMLTLIAAASALVVMLKK